MTSGRDPAGPAPPAPTSDPAPVEPPAEPVLAGPRAEPGERGQLVIAPLVVRRIAEHAADRCEGTAKGRGRRGAAAKVRGNGDDVDVELEVALVYPQAVREAAQLLRTAVASDVHRLTGQRVRRVAVTVVGLLPDLTSRVD